MESRAHVTIWDIALKSPGESAQWSYRAHEYTPGHLTSPKYCSGSFQGPTSLSFGPISHTGYDFPSC